MQAARVETVALLADIPAVREADRVAAMLAATVAALVAAASAVAVAMRAASAAAADMAAALAAAVDMAVAAAIGKLLRLSEKRLVCFGRRAFFCGLKIQTKGMTESTEDYCGTTSMPVTVA
jgi:uncharacterized membrane protein YdfJ with MMPL/SSD domain